MFAFQHAGLSDTGRVRKKNEDRWVATPALGLYMVVDGMGGRVAGDVAADIVAKSLPHQVRERLPNVPDPMNDAFTKELQSLMCQLSDTLVTQTRGEFGLEGLGATVVVLLVRQGRGVIAHLGDSRAYLLRGKNLARLTHDHTIVQLLLDRGEIQPDEAAAHAARHQITRFIGMHDVVPPDIKTIDLRPKDRVLLCSDGLSGMVGDTQLQRLLAETSDPAEACQRLIAAANDAGGLDNITAVVVDVS